MDSRSVEDVSDARPWESAPPQVEPTAAIDGSVDAQSDYRGPAKMPVVAHQGLYATRRSCPFVCPSARFISNYTGHV